MRYKAVLFDLDGTLINTAPGIIACAKKTMSDLGIPIPPDTEFDKFIGPPLPQCFQLVAGCDEATCNRAAAHYKSLFGPEYTSQFKPYPGMDQLLAQLKETGVPLGVATFKQPDPLRQSLDRFDMLPYFDVMVGSNPENTRTKGEIILLVLQQLGIDPGPDVLMVGDSPYDYEGACDAGVDFAAAAYGFGFKGVHQIPGSCVAHNVQELSDFILKDSQDTWCDLAIHIDSKDTAAAEAIAGMTVPYGFYTEDYSDMQQQVEEIAHIDLIDEGLLQKDPSKAIIHLYLQSADQVNETILFLKERFAAAGILADYTVNQVRMSEWTLAYQKYYHTQKVGKRLIVRPVWEEYTPNPGEAVLSLDPGAAFGTGSHETTKMILELMQDVVQPGDSILDLGCGSGILAIAALLLGAGQADLCDIDPLAVKVAKENAQTNGVDQQCHFTVGDLAVAKGKTYRVIFANIVADVILRLLPDIRQYMAPDGVFIASGIVDFRQQEVVSAMEEHGLTVVQTQTKNGWCAVVAR